MRKCFYGYSQNTTGPSYCPNSTLYTGKIPWATEQVLFHCCCDWWKVSRNVCRYCLGFSWPWPFFFKGVLRIISTYPVASLWHEWRQPGIIWPPPVAQRYHGMDEVTMDKVTLHDMTMKEVTMDQVAMEEMTINVATKDYMTIELQWPLTRRLWTRWSWTR